jgi:2-hydroxy-3-oxopropionate reductase
VSADKVGFVGLGIMGRPMARNLMAAGHELVVHNRSREVVEELESEGAEAAASSREVAERSAVTITMLPDSPDVHEAVLGADGALAGASKSDLLIDMSTISPVVAREIADAAEERGVAALDAPVSGGETGAIEGKLSIMVGGREESVERARPIFEAMGTPTHVGEAGAGQVTKTCNNLVVALVIQAVSEALVLGSKAGVDPDQLMTALSGGLAGTKVMEVKRSNFLEHDFAPGFRVELHKKDLGIALDTARLHGVPLMLTPIVDQMLAALQVAGRGRDDHSVLLAAVERAAGHVIGKADAAAR